MFLAGPLFGKYMSVLGVYRVFVFGVVGTGVCGCLFGCLTFLNTTWSFLGCSYALRYRLYQKCYISCWVMIKKREETFS